MKNMKINVILMAILLALTASISLAQSSVRFISSGGEGGLGIASDGTAWASDTWTFELGVFSSEFTPAVNNLPEWFSAWTSTYVNAGTTGSSEWWNDGGIFYYEGEGGYLTNDAPFTIGTQLYVWGYNTKDLDVVTAEWILLANDSWTVVSTATPNTDELSTTDSGTYAVLGAITNGGYDLQSASVGGSPIPEPAAIAAFLGAGILGFAVWRRFKPSI